MTSVITTASATLGAGTALAVLAPERFGWQGRALATGSTYAAAQANDWAMAKVRGMQAAAQRGAPT